MRRGFGGRGEGAGRVYPWLRGARWHVTTRLCIPQENPNKDWEPEVKRNFLVKVYSIVSCQLAVTVAFCALAMYEQPHPQASTDHLAPLTAP